MSFASCYIRSDGDLLVVEVEVDAGVDVVDVVDGTKLKNLGEKA